MIKELFQKKLPEIKILLKDLLTVSSIIFTLSFYLEKINPQISMFLISKNVSLFFVVFFLSFLLTLKKSKISYFLLSIINFSLLILFLNITHLLNLTKIIQEFIFAYFILSSVFFIFSIIKNTDSMKELLGQKTKTKSDFLKNRNLVIFSLFLIFIAIQITKIFNNGIGTDEGNALYTARLILQDNLILYKDFWAREPMGVFFLIPHLKVFGISLISLRFFVLIINILAFFLLFLISKKYLTQLSQIIILFVGIFIANNTFNIYAGIFYQFWVLFSILTIFLILNLSEKFSTKKLALLATITGFSILCYKGFMIFWIIIPLCLFLIFKKNIRKTLNYSLLFLGLNLIPILIFFIYFSLKTDFYHIYKIILGDVLIKLLIIILALLFSKIIFKLKPLKNYFQNIKFSNLLFFLGLFSIIISIIIFLTQKDSAKIFWGGFSNEAFYFIVSLISILILIQDSWKRFIVIILSLVFLFLIFCLGFGDTGFFGTFSDKELSLLNTLIVIFTISLFFFNNKKNILKKISPSDKIILTTTLILYLGFFFGGYLMPARILMILPIYPILLVFIIKILSRNDITKKTFSLFLILNFSFLLFTNYLFIFKGNSYTIYSKKDFNNSVQFLKKNTTEGDLIFSSDTAILAEIPATNLIPLTSPWNFRDTEKPHYLYDNINPNYSKILNLDKKVLLEKMIEKKPKYIFGNSRITFFTFFNNNTEVEQEIKNLLEQNYEKVEEFGDIKIYKIKD
jgi:hypothetical protein